MNDLANPASPEPRPLGGASKAAGASQRAKLFTPLDSAPMVRERPLGRLAPVTALIQEELEEFPAVGASPAARHPAPGSASHPKFTPNEAIPFLQRVHASSNPEAAEHRVRTTTRALGLTILIGAVLAAAASGIYFRATRTAEPVAAQAPTAAATAPAALSPAETAAALHSAVTFLEASLAPSAPNRRSKDPMPSPPHTGSQTEPAVSDSTGPTLFTDRARLLSFGSLQIALVPLTDRHGLPRTAAVFNRGHGWQVDDRSVSTPETASWPALLDGIARGPHLVRLLIECSPEGQWTVTRPRAAGPTRWPARVASGTRVAAELKAALAQQPGRPLAADVYVTLASDQSLNIVDWTRDKWSL